MIKRGLLLAKNNVHGPPSVLQIFVALAPCMPLPIGGTSMPLPIVLHPAQVAPITQICGSGKSSDNSIVSQFLHIAVNLHIAVSLLNSTHPAWGARLDELLNRRAKEQLYVDDVDLLGSILA